MKNKTLSIIFITYNRPNLFPKALKSIQNQSFKNFTTLVIDNGSTPPISLPEEISTDPRFELTRFEHNDQGFSRVINLIKTIESKYTAFLFDDDRWKDQKLEKQISYLEANPDRVACFTHAEFIDENGRKIDIPEDKNPFIQNNRDTEDWISRFFKEGNCLSQASAVLRTSALKRSLLAIPYVRLPDFSWWVSILLHGNIHVIEDTLTQVGWSNDGSNLSAINNKEKSNQLTYESSRILFQIRSFPESTLRRAFGLDDKTPRNQIELAMVQKAIEYSTEAHFRFAAEVAEDNFKIAQLKNDVLQATEWRKLYQKASGQCGADFKATVQQTHFEPQYNYYQWQSKRTIIAEEIHNIERSISQNSQLKFYLCTRLAPGLEAALADTLDSLSGQFYSNWHFDIVTELPTPYSLNEIPCIGWHTAKTEEHKRIIDEQVELQLPDWCVEIPAGARLDPLYLWRLSIEANRNPDIRCLFVDDDCFDNSSQTFAPRFKPGCNPSALESADIAGPVCISRETWNSIGGASECNASPWFHQLLRISRNHGWGVIKHISDVLISYPKTFPSDTQSCMFALLEHLNYYHNKTEIIPTTSISWAFRHQLTSTPKVSIAIISKGRLELLNRCIDSIAIKTAYPSKCLEIIVVLNHEHEDPDVTFWLSHSTNRYDFPFTAIRTPSNSNKATRTNSAVRFASGEFTLLLDEEAVITESNWLNDLLGTCNQPGIGGSTPCLIRPEANTIHHAGLVLGINGISIPLTGSQTGRTLETNIAMKGIAGPLYEKMAMYDNTGYLSSIKMPRDVSVMSGICMLVRTQAYREVGGMDENAFGETLADIDLSLKMRQKGWRLIYQPLATVGFGDVTDIEIPAQEAEQAKEALNQANARETFKQRWWPKAAVDPLWSPNLSLSTPNPTPEINYLAPWQYLPLNTPKILACPVDGGQGIIRINQPVEALRKAGLAQVFLHPQKPTCSPMTPAELLRLSPDSAILHHFFNNTRLPELQSWHSTPGRPFLVFAMDDLVTALDEANPFKKNIPTDSRSRLKKALALCDRLVVSTEYLGNTCANLISDIRVVPNYLEQKIWLPLRSQRRTTPKPRIGWAGGITHYSDLLLLKEIIERTRNEADWIFFGMCPDEIKPLLSEYHSLVTIDQYPSYLASLNLDIAVAPLAQTPFNRAKSNLRLLEYGILGIPVVCTDIDPYQNTPACCVPNIPDAWVNALRERIYDADARDQEGRAMRAWVIKTHLLENNLETWLSAHLPC